MMSHMRHSRPFYIVKSETCGSHMKSDVLLVIPFTQKLARLMHSFTVKRCKRKSPQ
jgi:hypothetical protein